MREGSGTITSIGGRHLGWCSDHNMMMLLLNTVCDFRSSHHKICFLVILANSCLGHSAASGPVERVFCPVLTCRRFECGIRRARQLWKLRLHFEVAPFVLFFFYGLHLGGLSRDPRHAVVSNAAAICDEPGDFQPHARFSRSRSSVSEHRPSCPGSG